MPTVFYSCHFVDSVNRPAKFWCPWRSLPALAACYYRGCIVERALANQNHLSTRAPSYYEMTILPKKKTAKNTKEKQDSESDSEAQSRSSPRQNWSSGSPERDDPVVESRKFPVAEASGSSRRRKRLETKEQENDQQETECNSGDEHERNATGSASAHGGRRYTVEVWTDLGVMTRGPANVELRIGGNTIREGIERETRLRDQEDERRRRLFVQSSRSV